MVSNREVTITACMIQPVRAPRPLHWVGATSTAYQEDDMRGRGEVEADAAAAQRDEEHSLVGVSAKRFQGCRTLLL